MNKRERTREEIISKVAPIFNSKGFEATSLRDITEATGLTKGSVYGNFKDKEEVALEVLKYNIGKISEMFTKSLVGKSTTIEKLKGYIEAYQKYGLEIDSMGGCPMLNSLVDRDEVKDRLYDYTAFALKKWKDSIVKLVETGIHNSEIKPDSDPDFISEALISLFEGGPTLSKATSYKGYKDSALKLAMMLIENITKE